MMQKKEEKVGDAVFPYPGFKIDMVFVKSLQPTVNGGRVKGTS